MSIDARIAAVCFSKDGLRLHLEPREPGGVAGQTTLTIVNPPPNAADCITLLIGTEIWGDSSQIMIRETKWADRVGYAKIRLVEKTKQ